MLKIIAAIVGLSLLGGTALADGSVAQRLRTEYDNCVWMSSLTQEVAGLDANLGMEMAFQSCATEERAMAAWLASSYVPVNQINMTIGGIKLQFKRRLREIWGGGSSSVKNELK